MAIFADQVYGVGMGEIWYEEGHRWNVIELPFNTHCADEPEDTSFDDIDPIEDTMADGSLYFLDRGCRPIFPLTIDPVTRVMYQQLAAYRGWQAQNPDHYAIYRRHSDKNEAYRVKFRGPLRDPWSHGVAAGGYAVSFTLVGIDQHNSAEPDNEIVSHYTDTTIVYDATDTGVHSYAATGCPWEFGGYANHELPPQWLTTGTTDVDRLVIDYAPVAGLRSQGAERAILDYVTPDNGEITAQLLLHAGIGGLIWRSNAAMGTYYAIRISVAAQTIDIYKVGALLNSFASPILLVLDEWNEYRVQFIGSIHRVYMRPLTGGSWLFVGQSTDNSYLTGYAGQFTIAGGDMLGRYHDIYSSVGVRAELDTVTLALAAYYTPQPKFTLPWL